METENPKILILLFSMYGHTFQMAKAVEEGVKNGGGEPVLKQVEELMPEKYWDENVRKAKEMMKDIPVADPRKDLNNIKSLIVGTPTRYGNMCSQMRNFWDQTGEDWQKGTLIGLPASIFTSTATQHGGQETTIVIAILTLLHHGLIIVGFPYSFQDQSTLEEIAGGSPYGVSTIAGTKGERMPSERELGMAKDMGSYHTSFARKFMEK